MTKRFGFAFLLFLAASVRADFNFMVQGRLSDGEGNPIGVRTSVEWHLFRGGDPTVADGTPVYRESGFITPVNALGVFSYELGSGTAMDSPLDVSAYTGPEPIYALLLVGGSPLLPKLRVTPVPRSHVAAVAESVQSDGVDTPALKDGAVTGPKIAAGAISGTHLNNAAQLNVDRIGLGGAPATSLDLGAKTDAVRLPLGTIAQRPATPVHGDTRYNTETNAVESYVNGSWQSLSTNAGTVTNVTASTPLASSGGTTPALSIAQADTATGGYLSSSDWNTFNNKLNPALTAGQLFVGNDSNTAVGSPLSGDATLSSAGALTLASTGTAGTYTKVTTDAKGRVVSSATLEAADIPNLDAGKITSGTIDPARIPAGTDSGKLPLAGGTMSGAIDMGGNNITNGGTVAASTITVGGSNVLAASSALTSGSVLFANGATSAGQDNSNLFWDNTNKRLGIGTVAPIGNVEVSMTSVAGGAPFLATVYTSVGNPPDFMGRLSRGAVGSPSAPLANDPLARFMGTGYASSGWQTIPKGGFTVNAAETWTDSAQGTYLAFLTTLAGGTTRTEKMRIDNNGNVGIGSTNPSAKLTVGAMTDTTSQMTLQGEYQAAGFTNNNIFNFRHGGYDRIRLVSSQKSVASNNFDFGVQTLNATVDGYNEWLTVKGLTGNVGVGTVSPTARLHLSSGTATANTAPLKLTAGTNLTTPEAGAVEFDGSNLYFSTNTTTRQTFAFQGSAGTLSGLTPGSVLFANGAASAGQDNSNLFWDNTNKRLGIRTASPESILDVDGGITTNTTVPLRLKIAGEVSANASEIRTGSGLFKIYSGRQAAAHQSFDFSTGDNTLSGATRLFIAGSSGNVGISTTSPAGKLDVNQPTAGSVAIQAQTSPTVFWKVVSPAGGITGGYSAENAVEYVAKDSGTNRSINAAGTINASGADFAEWVDWAGPQPDMGSIVKYRGAYVVVSSSATAAFVGNDVKDPRHAILVAFAGQLPVWVKGKVNEGDLIVANGDGTGRGIARESATLADAQKAVGTAWASSADDGIKRVHVAVGLGLAGGGWEHEKIKELEREIAEIKRENTAIKERLDQIEKAMTKAK